MTKRRPRAKESLLAAALCVVVMVVFHAGVLRTPGHWVLNGADDAIKNYFGTLWAVRYDSGYWFTGANYPVGEHLVYIDGEPPLVALLRLILPAGDHASWVVGTMNVVMFASIPVAAVLMALLLRRYGAGGPAATASAAVLALMSPQVLRIPVHQALAQGWIIPAVWWLAANAVTRQRTIPWLVGLAAVVLFGGALHPYYVPLSALIVLAIAVVAARAPQRRGAAVRAAVTVLASGMLVYVAIRLTDPLQMRPREPRSVWLYNSNVGRMLLPFDQPGFVAWWKGTFGSSTPSGADGPGAFIGILGWIGVALLVMRLVRWLRDPRRRRRWRTRDAELLGIGAPALIIATASLAGPLFLLLKTVFPPMAQFRGVGRFEWVSWLAIMLMGAGAILRQARAWRITGRSRSATILLAVSGVAAVADVWMRHSTLGASVRERRVATADAFGPLFGNVIGSNASSPAGYSAILPIPAFHAGGETLTTPDESFVSAPAAFHAAYELGIPLAVGQMSRTPLDVALRTRQLSSDSLIPREILSSYRSRAPLLLVVAGEPATPGERWLVSRADTLGRVGDVLLMRLPLERIRSDARSWWNQWDSLRAVRPGESVVARRTSSLVRFEELSATDSSRCGGELPDGAEKRKVLFDESVVIDSSTAQLEASVWIRPIPDHAVLRAFIAEVTDSSGRTVESRMRPTYSAEIHGPCLLARVAVPVAKGRARVRLIFEGRPVSMGSLLLRPTDLDVFTSGRDGSRVAVNNIPLPAR